jgi:hypothetical protein
LAFGNWQVGGAMMVPGFIPKQAFEDELKSVVEQLDGWAHEYVDKLGKAQSTALLLKGSGEGTNSVLLLIP